MGSDSKSTTADIGTDDRPFWEPDPDLTAEEEAHAVATEILKRPPNLDFVLDFPYPSASDRGASGWGLRLTVQGGRMPDIVARFDLGKLIEEEIDSHASDDGLLYLSPHDYWGLYQLRRRMKDSASSLNRALQSAIITSSEGVTMDPAEVFVLGDASREQIVQLRKDGGRHPETGAELDPKGWPPKEAHDDE